MNFNIPLTMYLYYFQHENYNFEEGDELSDLQLVFPNKTLHVHKVILGNASSVFKQKILSLSEKRRSSIMHLPREDVEDFIEFLRFIYPHKARDIDESKCEKLFGLSNRYDVSSVRALAEKALIRKIDKCLKSQKHFCEEVPEYRSHDKIMKILEGAVIWELKQLEIICLTYLAKMIDQSYLERHRYYDIIEDKDKIEILKYKLTLATQKVKVSEKTIKKLEAENSNLNYELNLSKI